MIIDSKEKVFQQRKTFLPPSLGAEATYFLIIPLCGTLSTEISLHRDISEIWEIQAEQRHEGQSASEGTWA